MTDRILWNRRPDIPRRYYGDIDELVVHNCTVHIEQMDDRCWWIGIHRSDGTYWSGNFSADRYGRMTFWQQENEGVSLFDQTHEEAQQ